MSFRETTLPNGLSIVAEVDSDAATMAAGFFVRTGSRDETPEVAGVSHFLEHMMFKGTERRTVFDINREFDELGADYNAFTSEETTVYYANVLPEFQRPVVDLLADMMRPALRAEDFDVEKGVILEEIAVYEDQPHFRLYDAMMSAYFAAHPLGSPILGTAASIEAMELEAMREYFARRYAPDNLIAVGVGTLDWDAFVAQLVECCGGWTPGDNRRWTGPPAAPEPKRILADPALSRQQMGLVCDAPGAQDERRYAAQLLATVLGDVTGSRLYYALIEPALADDAQTVYSPMDHVGALLTFLSCDPDNAPRALEIARETLARFAEEGPTERELQAAKNKTATAATLKGELPMGRLTAVGFDWLYRQEYIPLDEQIAAVFDVSSGEILELARQLPPDGGTLVTLGPREQL